MKGSRVSIMVVLSGLILSTFLWGSDKDPLIARFDSPRGFIIHADGLLLTAAEDGFLCDLLSTEDQAHGQPQRRWIGDGHLPYWEARPLYARVYEIADLGGGADLDPASLCQRLQGSPPLAEGAVSEQWSDQNTCQWTEGRDSWLWKVQGNLTERARHCKGGVHRFNFGTAYRVREGSYVVDDYCQLRKGRIVAEMLEPIQLSCPKD